MIRTSKKLFLCFFPVSLVFSVDVYPSVFESLLFWADEVSEHTSFNEVEIHLSTGKVVRGEFIPSSDGELRRIAELKLPKVYITWKPYLDGNKRNQFHFDAALPDLEPKTVWIKEYLESVKKNEGQVSHDDEVYANQQWVKITLSLWGFANSLCKEECSRGEHNNLVVQNYLTRYEVSLGEQEGLDLSKYVSASESIGVKGREFYLPLDLDLGYYFIECSKDLGYYHWCNATTQLNNDLVLRYQFEKSHINDWKEIDSKVKSLVNMFLISHSTQIEEVK